MKTFFIGVLFFLAGVAQAEVSLIAVPSKLGVNLAPLWRHKAVLSHQSVFSGLEKLALIELGQRTLAQSYELKVSSLHDASLLKAWVVRQKLAVSLDYNSLGKTLAEPLESYQWALHNTGEGQRIIVDDVSSTIVPGKVGEDLNFGQTLQEFASSKKIRVAVLDTGVDYNHPNLKPNLVKDPEECVALQNYKNCLKKDTQVKCDQQWAGVDANKNGYPLDCSGWNVTSGRNPHADVFGNADASDEVGHGTHLAGIIAGAANGQGIRGVSQNAEILPVKVIKSAPNAPLRPQGDLRGLPPSAESELHWSTAFADLIARGMLYAIRSDAQVINLSLGWPTGADSVLMRKMVELAIQRGIVVVAAAGNDSADSRVMPCQYEGVICVASHGPDGAFSHFSNFGTFVDIAAPGLDILSTWPRQLRSIRFTAKEGYEFKNGTSMAAPFVAGAVARLLAAGVPSSDIYPRLILGARPTLASGYKYQRSGNLDIAQSLKTLPQPLILPEKKEVVRLTWDRQASHLPLTLSLKNYWADTGAQKLSAEVLQESGIHSAHLSQSQWQIPEWKRGEVKKLEMTLVIDHPQIDGRLFIEVRIEGMGKAPRVFRMPLEVAVSIGRESVDPEIEHLPIEGGRVAAGAELRSVSALDGQETQDYIAIVPAPGGASFQLLRQFGQSYQIVAQGKMDAEGDLYLIQRLDIQLRGKTNYVFIFRMPPVQGKQTPAFRIQIYDEKMKLEQKVDYDNQTAVLSEQFKWLRVEEAGKVSLAPAWMAFGKIPPLEKPAANAWEPNPEDPLLQRLYYLSLATKDATLHSVEVPENYTLVQVLAQSMGQKMKGSLSLVLAKGEGYDLEFFSADLNAPKIDWGNLVPLRLPEFRMLLGMKSTVEITPLDAQAQITGNAFTSDSDSGAKRTTLIQTAGERPTDSFRTLDLLQRPVGLLDSVTRVAGAYLGEHTGGIFSESHYLLQYLDTTTGESTSTSLDRFSFLPSFIFSKTFFPVVAQSTTRRGPEERLPAIHIPASLGVTDAVEVVVPVYDAQTGRLQGLAHPARLRFKTDGSCVSMGKSVGPDARGPSRLVFFCGDQFLRAPVLF